MKYSVVLAALSTAAIATSAVHVEVSDDTLIYTSDSVSYRQHRDRDDHSHHNSRGWFFGLWSALEGTVCFLGPEYQRRVVD
jgi:hypothetical protein